MPVTIRPSSQPLAKHITDRLNTPHDVLKTLFSGTRMKECDEILQSSFAVSSSSRGAISTNLTHTHVHGVELNNALVGAAVRAYNNHHHLIIRPDDVWISILTQFNLYVNANAEELRSKFVAHEGKKELIVNAVGTRYTIDFGDMAQQMTQLMEQHIVDSDLRSWIMADFTTTTAVDKVVFAITMMSTLQKYFDYGFCLTCNLPAITLLGEKSDWECLLTKIDKLLDYSKQTRDWHALLKPVLKRFVETFEQPESKSTATFWNRIVHYVDGGSGSPYICGWITAFCAFNNDGKPLFGGPVDPDRILVLDGVQYPCVDTDDIPSSYCSVPVKLIDNNKEFSTVMVAGALATKTMDSKDVSPDLDGTQDSIQPISGWIMYAKPPANKK